MGEAQQLDLNLKPQEFFREQVSRAVANQDLEIGDELEFYLVNLLCDFITPEKLETLAGELDALETPLALMLKEALEAPPSYQMRIYKYMGDTSLYIAGFFQEFFNRKAFDVSYYITVGSTAYGSASHIMRDQFGDEHFTAVYRELADRFQQLVEVVAEISDHKDEGDILALYDRWTRSPSERLRRLLEKHGVTPMPVSKTES